MRHVLVGFLLARGLASAHQLAQAAGGITIGIPLPTPTEAPPPPAGVTPAPLARRAVDRQCLTSVLSELSPPTTALDSALLSWATQNDHTGGCTLTMPASLSKAYSSYVDVLQTYFSTLSSKAQCLRKCGASRLSVTVTATCKESLTLVFTGGSGATTTTTSMKQVDVPNSTVFIGDGIFGSACKKNYTSSAITGLPPPESTRGSRVTEFTTDNPLASSGSATATSTSSTSATSTSGAMAANGPAGGSALAVVAGLVAALAL